MKISEKHKYYLLKAYNALKITGNICALSVLCLWCWQISSSSPKGQILIWERCANFSACMYKTKIMIFLVINFYICWKMAKNLFKIYPLKYHIIFWLSPFVIAYFQALLWW